MLNWLKLDYLFTNNLLPITPEVFRWGVIIYLAVFAAAIVFSFLRKNNKFSVVYRRLFQKLSNWSFTFSIIGLVLMFFRHQLIPYLGMRAWTLLWWLAAAIWMIYILKYLFVDIPKQKEEIQAQREFEKYLP